MNLRSMFLGLGESRSQDLNQDLLAVSADHYTTKTQRGIYKRKLFFKNDFISKMGKNKIA